MLHHRLHSLGVETEVLEEGAVGQEAHEGAVLLSGVYWFGLRDELTLLKLYGDFLAVAHRRHGAAFGEGVDGLEADAVEADRLLEILVVELAAGVDLGGDVLDLAKRDAAAKVAHGDLAIFGESDVDARAHAHVELVDGVVHDLLDQDVDAVVGVRTVAEFTDIHAGAPADMLVPAQRLDRLVGVGSGRRRALRLMRSRSGGRSRDFAFCLDIYIIVVEKVIVHDTNKVEAPT